MGASQQKKARGEVPRRLGRYELIAKIAAGGMAEVYLAHQVGPMNFQKVVVVKVIHPHLASQSEFTHMFLDEARISALLKHHNVVDIYDLGVEGEMYFIAMEYIPGQALSRVISRTRQSRALDIFTAVDIIAEAANGLDAAHNLSDMNGEPLELVHRDVSPGNILVSYAGGVKLVDFGVAKSLGQITIETTAELRGKLGYASPEQLSEGPIDRRSDIWSLGVVLWESLALERLYRCKTPAATVKKILDGNPPPPSSKREGVPQALDDICLKALALRPDDRFQTAAEMRSALLEVLRDAKHYSDRKALAAFMSETFAAERSEHESLIARIARSNDEVEELDFDIDIQVVAPLEPDPDPDEPSAELEPELIFEGDPADEGRSASVTVVGPAGPKRWWLVASASVGALAALAVIFAMSGVTRDHSAPTASPASAPAAAPARPGLEKAAPAAQPEPAPEVTVAAPAAGDPPAQPAAAPEPSPSADADDATSPEPETQPVAPAPLDEKTRAHRAVAYLRKGTQLFARGKLRGAIYRFNKALEYRPDYPAALRGLGLAHARAGHAAKARHYLTRYLQVSPRAGDAGSIRRRLAKLR